MKQIKIGVKDKSLKYGFRETCFGICIKNNKVYLTSKNGEISLIGGGKEKGETFNDCLCREFLEESGCKVKSIEGFCTIDCFWTTRTNYHMESLSHFFLVDIEDEIKIPKEKDSKLVMEDINNVIDKLELPYQRKAMEIYINEYKDTKGDYNEN